MARKVSELAVNALIGDGEFSRDNTTVENGEMRLHRNLIAKKVGENYTLSLCGWNTPTTRERLNTLCDALGHGRPFHQKKGEPFYNDKEISSTDVITVSRQ